MNINNIKAAQQNMKIRKEKSNVEILKISTYVRSFCAYHSNIISQIHWHSLAVFSILHHYTLFHYC